MALGAILLGDWGLEGDLLLHRLALYRLVFGLSFNFSFHIGLQPVISVVIVSGGQQRRTQP